jgi:hypothetical protein
MVLTVVQTPRFCGDLWDIALRFWEFHPFKRAGDFAFLGITLRPFLIN